MSSKKETTPVQRAAKEIGNVYDEQIRRLEAEKENIEPALEDLEVRRLKRQYLGKGLNPLSLLSGLLGSNKKLSKAIVLGLLGTCLFTLSIMLAPIPTIITFLVSILSPHIVF